VLYCYPPFEQRRVQVRIRVSEEAASQGKGKNTSLYQNLNLYIRLDPLQHQFLPQNSDRQDFHHKTDEGCG
ncbi:MAG: hypothetical protein U0L10_10920, partial [Lachnospiraceae bacterium]|nr:hypothetical protein [Lachnospiraceae bacterium]